MNIPILVVAIIMTIVVFAHVFGGTKETATLAPAKQAQQESANWVQAMCAFQMLSIDLLVVTGLSFTIALSDVLPNERAFALGLAALFAAWGVVWIIQMLVLKQQGITLLRLPHWVAWFLCSGLMLWGA